MMIYRYLTILGIRLLSGVWARGDEQAAGRRNLLNALKRTPAKKTGLVLVLLTLFIQHRRSSAVLSHSSQKTA
jgi:hypothetical protein